MPPLTHEILAEFEERLEKLGVLAVAEAQPGLSEDEIDATVAPYGIALSREARNWWGWRGGVPAGAGPAAMEVGPARKWLTLSEALEHREALLAIQKRDHVQEPISLPGRLPLIGADGLYLIDPSGASDVAPVWVLWPDDPPDMPPAAASIGDLIGMWLEAIKTGAWTYDRRAYVWQINHERRQRLQGAKQGVV